jgi:hypothetical protein
VARRERVGASVRLTPRGGNFGLKSLYAYIAIDLFEVPYPARWFLYFTLLVGTFTTFLTFRYRNIVLQFTLWVCLFFMISRMYGSITMYS